MVLIANFLRDRVKGNVRHLRMFIKITAIIPALLVFTACGLDQQLTQALDPEKESINPVAVIDAPDTAGARSYITIDGSQSYSHRNIALTYSWTLTEKPRCSSAGFGITYTSTDTDTTDTSTTSCVENDTLTATTSGVTLYADKGGYYTVTLSVTETVETLADGTSTAQTATSQLTSMRINVVGNGSNHPPVAVAKSSFSATNVAALDATESYDADGQPLSYMWSIMSESSTSGVDAEITYTTSSIAYLYNWLGSSQTYLVKLHVSDGQDYDEAVLQVSTD